MEKWSNWIIWLLFPWGLRGEQLRLSKWDLLIIVVWNCLDVSLIQIKCRDMVSVAFWKNAIKGANYDRSYLLGLCPPFVSNRLICYLSSIVCLFLLWIVWRERNARIFEDTWKTPEMMWDALHFFVSFWAYCTDIFKPYLLSVIQLSWLSICTLREGSTGLGVVTPI